MTEVSARAETRARIVEVAARLLHEDGPAAVTTRAVADGAGVQAPTIYRLFGDKNGLLDAVAEHVLSSHVSAKAEAERAASAAQSDAVADLRASWLAQIEFGVANPAVFRMLGEPGRVRTSPAARAGHEVLAARIHRVAATGRLRVPEPRAVALVQAAGVGVVQSLLAALPADRDPGLADAMLAAVLAQVVTDTDDPAEHPAVSAAVTLRAASPDLAVLTSSERQLLADWLDRVLAS